MSLLKYFFLFSLLTFSSHILANPASENLCKSTIDPVIYQHDLILLGEVHGTNQAPDFFFQTICNGLKVADKVYVLLEKSQDEQVYFDRFFAGKGGLSLTQLVEQQPSWHSKLQDGRKSQAIARLLSNLKQLKQQGGNIEVVAVATSDEQRKAGLRKAEAMAANVKAIMAKPANGQRIKYIGLFGRTHVRLEKVSHSSKQEKKATMAYLLESFKPLSLEMKFLDGHAWFCRRGKVKAVECGDYPRLGNVPDWQEKSAIGLYNQADSGYSGGFFVGEISSSPPMINE